jgi:hypothetical protein
VGELYERVLGEHPTKPKISTDGLQAALVLRRQGVMTDAQVNQMFADHYGGALGTAPSGSDAGRQEAADLVSWLTAGNATQDLQRAALLERVLVMVDLRAAPVNTPTGIRGALNQVFPTPTLPDRS